MSRPQAAAPVPSASRTPSPIIGGVIAAPQIGQPLPPALEIELSPSDPLRTLHRGGWITAAVIASAMRWRRDWLLYEEGYTEASRCTGAAGDIHVLMQARVRAGAQIRAVRDGIGETAERWLRVILVEGASYRAAAAHLLPRRTVKANELAPAVVAAVLIALDQRLETLRRYEEMRVIASRKTKAALSSDAKRNAA